MPESVQVITIDHDEIRDWVEDRNGYPAILREDALAGEDGALRIVFGTPGRDIARIDWDRFFKVFESGDLAFSYRDEVNDGGTYVCAFVDREEHLDQIENGGIPEAAADDEFNDELELMEEEEA